MRIVEQNLLESFRDHKAETVSTHDRIEIESGKIKAYLWGTCYCTYDTINKTLELGIPGGRWQTATTKSRINTFAHYFGVPGLYQYQNIFYWSDNKEPYNNSRIYSNIEL